MPSRVAAEGVPDPSDPHPLEETGRAPQSRGTLRLDTMSRAFRRVVGPQTEFVSVVECIGKQLPSRGDIQGQNRPEGLMIRLWHRQSRISRLC